MVQDDPGNDPNTRYYCLDSTLVKSVSSCLCFASRTASGLEIQFYSETYGEVLARSLGIL
jgi:hypothetical protein